mmetsp:Transcript_7540/g.13140  ORF Transcript_7540/g.13140 Transcript_7540/m.13140 type:complete len:272 (-) Transcript_7540:8-823(-)
MGAHSLLQLLATAQQTGAPGCNQTNLGTRHGLARHRGGVSHVLMVSSSVRVLHGVHGRTAHLRPAVPLHAILVVVVSSLQHWLVHAATTRDDAHDGPAGGRQALAAAGGKTNAGLASIIGMAHYHARGARRTGKTTTICCLLLTHGDHGSLRHLGQRQHVPDRQLSLGATVHELSSVTSFHCHPQFLLQLVAVRVMEDHLTQGSTTTRIVQDLLDQALDVALALDIVHCAQLHSTLPQPGLRSEDEGLTLTRTADDAAHGCYPPNTMPEPS